MDDDQPPRDTRVDQAANVGNVYVANQTIYYAGRAQSIRDVPTEALQHTAKLLASSARAHDARALMLVVVTIVVWGVITKLLMAWTQISASASQAEWIAFVVLSAFIPGVIWMFIYNIHRRDRVAMHVADARWAEIDVELSIRSDRTR